MDCKNFDCSISVPANWFVCINEGNVAHENQIGLLHMNFPQVFIVVKDLDKFLKSDAACCSEEVAVVNFFNPNDRICFKNADMIAAAKDFYCNLERFYNNRSNLVFPDYCF